jgi:hypothetical protein
LPCNDRRALVQMAIDKESRSWIRFSPLGWQHELLRLQKQFPQLRFTHFDLGGADDAVRYQKWVQAGPDCRMIVMQRPGSTGELRRGVQDAGMTEFGTEHFIIGPEMPAISSTAARAASRRHDHLTLLQLCDPPVADWLCKETVARVETAGQRSLRFFREVQDRVKCPFARRARLWGSPDPLPNCTVVDHALACADGLAEFARESSAPERDYGDATADQPDGYVLCVEGAAYCDTLLAFAETVRETLTALCSVDPSGRRAMSEASLRDGTGELVLSARFAVHLMELSL